MKYFAIASLALVITLSACESPSSFENDRAPGLSSSSSNAPSLQSAALPEGMVYNPGTHNLYKAVNHPGVTWDEALAAADGLTYRSCRSHLATVTTASENDFIVANFPEAAVEGYFIGGAQAEGAPEPAGGWEWITGELFFYGAWHPGEPNDFFDPNDDFNENRIQYLPIFWGGGTGTWNDSDGSANVPNGGYVVEYECPGRVNGGGQIIILNEETGETVSDLQTGFSAVKLPDGSAQGQLEVKFTDSDLHMDVTCVSFDGNRGWIGAVTTQSDSDIYGVGIEWLIAFEDNGEGAGATPDRVSYYIYDPTPPSILASLCTAQPDWGIAQPQFDWTNGNVVVN